VSAAAIGAAAAIKFPWREARCSGFSGQQPRKGVDSRSRAGSHRLSLRLIEHAREDAGHPIRSQSYPREFSDLSQSLEAHYGLPESLRHQDGRSVKRAPMAHLRRTGMISADNWTLPPRPSLFGMMRRAAAFRTT
ncbi:MAG: hypothetical protein WB610_05455, partial [Rhodomicrobium sp.]